MALINSPLNLTDIAEVLKRRKNFILVFVLLSLFVAAVMVFFILPPGYKSTAVVVASNPQLADRARIYNDNVQDLYSAFGNEDDLNRLLGVAELDTTYKLLVKKFNLIKFYKGKGNDPVLAQRQAITALRKNVELVKNELFQLRIIVTTKDKYLSASIANSFAEIIQDLIRHAWKTPDEKTVQKLESSSGELEQQFAAMADSVGNNADLLRLKRQVILEQLHENQKLANQYRISIASNTPALIVLEQAYPSARADKPEKLLIMLGALLAALAFSVMLVVILERRQHRG